MLKLNQYFFWAKRGVVEYNYTLGFTFNSSSLFFWVLVEPETKEKSVDIVVPGGKYPMLKLAMQCEMKEVAVSIHTTEKY